MAQYKCCAIFALLNLLKRTVHVHGLGLGVSGSKTANLCFSVSQLASALELEFFYCVNAHIYVTIIFDLNITHPEQQRDWPKEAAATIPMEPVLIPTAQAGR
jgi:hypothetical protein